LLLTIVRNDVLGAWQRQIPDDAPNFFLINIQPEEVQGVKEFLSQRGVQNDTLYPMIRARLETINNEPVVDIDFGDRAGERFAERDFNLSYLAEARADNEVISGEWWDSDISSPQFSVEDDFASDIGVGIGDELQFQIADKVVTGVISNLRKVDWESFAVNFFVVGTPLGLDDKPVSFVSSVYVPDQQGEFVRDLSKLAQC